MVSKSGEVVIIDSKQIKNGSVKVSSNGASIKGQKTNQLSPDCFGIPRDPNAPKIVDETKGKPSINLELPKVWDRLLEKHSSKGRILTEEQFKNEFGK